MQLMAGLRGLQKLAGVPPVDASVSCAGCGQRECACLPLPAGRGFALCVLAVLLFLVWLRAEALHTPRALCSPVTRSSPPPPLPPLPPAPPAGVSGGHVPGERGGAAAALGGAAGVLRAWGAG